MDNTILVSKDWSLNAKSNSELDEFEDKSGTSISNLIIFSDKEDIEEYEIKKV